MLYEENAVLPVEPTAAAAPETLTPPIARFADYDKHERLLVPLLAVIAYLFARWVAPAEGGIGIALVDWLFCGVAAWYIGATGKHTRASVLWLTVAAVLALGMLFQLFRPQRKK